MHSEVIFDLETKKLFEDIEGDNPADLEVSIVGLYSREIDGDYNEVKGELLTFWEKDFSDMWSYFQKAERIIGFNSLGFDVPALSPYANFPFNKLPHFDIMQKVKEVFGKRLSLDALAKETLDREKSDTGLNAVYYWEKGDRQSLENLKKYCEEDVLITKEIYDYALKEGNLFFKDKWNTLRKIEVDFSYPNQKQGKQVKLFS